ncbi:MAG: beta-N-acetylhexosaminidase [Verrucomicrobiota bacterium]|jgi:hexosaminidase
MKNYLKILLGAAVLSAACTLMNAADVISIIPAPVKAEVREGQFQLTDATRILTDRAFRPEARLLAARLRTATGYEIKVRASTKPAAASDILLTAQDAGADTGAEGYALSISTTGVVVRATTPAGVFYGAQSLLQLLPPEIFSTNPVAGVAWRIPCVQIEDQPRFVWRGFMLDVSRHFFTKADVEQVLDLMSLYKLNTFHWHLVDDQGWRIEIKRYPKLTSQGAWRDGVGFGLDPQSTTAYDRQGRYGGFYTQREIREVVAYAAARHITIVPEIEMPGHSSAALAAYPQFACPSAQISTPTKGGVFRGVYCAGNDATFAFLGDILDEVTPLFPGKYIHIGGDEVDKSNWQHCPLCQARIKAENLKDEAELQSWFVRRMEKIVNAHGKIFVGWSEIREGGLAPSATLMDWIGGGAESAASGHDVVMTPARPIDYCYFDHYQSTNQAAEPKAIGGYLPLRRVYEFDPLPEKLAPEFQTHVLGGQANLWTEYVPNFRQVEYMMFPRLGALSEDDWSPKTARDWDDFQKRTALNEKRLDVLGVNYRALSKPD